MCPIAKWKGADLPSRSLAILGKSIRLQFERPNLAQACHAFSQISYLLVLIYYLNWPRYWNWFALGLTLAVLLNAGCYYFFDESRRRQLFINISPLLITTSLFLFITGETFVTYAVAITIAIVSRFAIRVKGAHVFNPSLLAVLAMIVWGQGIYSTPTINIKDTSWWLILIFTFGTITSIAANRALASYGYLLCFAFLELCLWFLGAPHPLIHMASLLSIPAGLFIFHVMTDPRTSPSRPRQQLLFGALIAAGDVALREFSVMFSNMVSLGFVYAAFVFIQQKEASLRQKLVPTAAMLALLGFGLTLGHFPRPWADPHSYGSHEPKPDINAEVVPFNFVESAASLGLGIPNAAGGSKIMALLFNTVPSTNLAVADFDGDGFQDILLSGPRTGLRLYKNIAGKRFVDVTEQAGLGPWRKVEVASFFDYNNDGMPDIFAITAGQDQHFKLLKNVAGRFVDATDSAGLPPLNEGNARSINFVDFDRDGFTDVLVANFPKFTDNKAGAPGSGTNSYPGAPKKNYLLKNHGGKFFTDETDALGLAGNEFSHVIGVADVNGDGFPDLYVANDFGRDRLFLN